jgi:hypothetical protein
VNATQRRPAPAVSATKFLRAHESYLIQRRAGRSTAVTATSATRRPSPPPRESSASSSAGLGARRSGGVALLRRRLFALGWGIGLVRLLLLLLSRLGVDLRPLAVARLPCGGGAAAAAALALREVAQQLAREREGLRAMRMRAPSSTCWASGVCARAAASSAADRRRSCLRWPAPGGARCGRARRRTSSRAARAGAWSPASAGRRTPRARRASCRPGPRSTGWPGRGGRSASRRAPAAAP